MNNSDISWLKLEQYALGELPGDPITRRGTARQTGCGPEAVT